MSRLPCFRVPYRVAVITLKNMPVLIEQPHSELGHLNPQHTLLILDSGQSCLHDDSFRSRTCLASEKAFRLPWRTTNHV